MDWLLWKKERKVCNWKKTGLYEKERPNRKLRGCHRDLNYCSTIVAYRRCSGAICSFFGRSLHNVRFLAWLIFSNIKSSLPSKLQQSLNNLKKPFEIQMLSRIELGPHAGIASLAASDRASQMIFICRAKPTAYLVVNNCCLHCPSFSHFPNIL